MRFLNRSANPGLAAALVTTLVTIAVACGGSAPLPSPTPGPTATISLVQSPAPETAQPPRGSESVFLELLGTIPDTVDTRQWVIVNDYALAREVFNVPLPGPNADEDALSQYLLNIVVEASPRPSIGPFISGHSESAIVQLDRPRYLAFDLREVDQSVEAGLPPAVLEVVRGRFDPAATDKALSACAECPIPDRQERHGVPFYSWGEDLLQNVESRFLPPAFDSFGRGGRIAVLDRYVFRTVETPGINALIDANGGNRRSLADVDEFRLLAKGMSTLESYSVLFSDMTQQVGGDIAWGLLGDGTQEERLRMAELQENFPILRSYQVFGTGAGRDEQGPYMAVVLVHADESSAIENAELLRARFLEAPPLPTWHPEPFHGIVKSVETQTDGRVLLAKVRGDELGARWLLWMYQLYPLLPHH